MTAIRSATLQDLPGVYRVCLQTGDSGRDATSLYRNPDLLGHVYAGPYVVGEPDLAFVVADDLGLAGYTFAAADSRAFEAWAELEWWPGLREQYPVEAGDSPDAQVIRLLHAPERAPEAILADYPAHLHIDLLPRVQGKGFGRLLVERVLGRLRECGVPGVHLGVAADNSGAIEFYRHLGFSTLAVDDDSELMALRLP